MGITGEGEDEGRGSTVYTPLHTIMQGRGAHGWSVRPAIGLVSELIALRHAV